MPPQNRENFTQNDVIFGCGGSAYPISHPERKEKADKMCLPGDDRPISLQVCELFAQHTDSQYIFVGDINEFSVRDHIL